MSNPIISRPPIPPQAYQKIMVFVDGSNLFHRFKEIQCNPVPLITIVQYSLFKLKEYYRRASPMLWGVSVYTVKNKYDELLKTHGDDFFKDTPVVFGHEVKHSGTKTEKGVDAQLVADIIYHSARRNCEQIMLIANDADYCYALRRVRDFGCKTSLVALIQEPTDYLKGACDEYLFIWEAIFANELKRKGNTLPVFDTNS